LPTLRNNRPVLKVLPPENTWGIARAPPSVYSSFLEEWKAQPKGPTFKRWGGAFVTHATLYKRDGEFEMINLDAEHYYNIVLTEFELSKFTAKNPRFKTEKCHYECLTKKSTPHYHAVHGFYSCSVVAEIHCAPPWRHSPAWASFGLTHTKLVRNAKVIPFSNAVCVLFPRSKAPEWLNAYWPIEGAIMLAEVCNAPVTDWTTAEWNSLCQKYQTPKSARWGLAKANSTAVRRETLLLQDFNVQYAIYVYPMLKGEGAPVFDVLQRIWKADGTAAKTLGNFLMRKLCSALDVELTPGGALRLKPQ
jgi:hypothetical protein